MVQDRPRRLQNPSSRSSIDNTQRTILQLIWEMFSIRHFQVDMVDIAWCLTEHSSTVPKRFTESWLETEILRCDMQRWIDEGSYRSSFVYKYILLFLFKEKKKTNGVVLLPLNVTLELKNRKSSSRTHAPRVSYKAKWKSMVLAFFSLYLI